MNQQPSEALKRERMLLAIMTAVLVLAAVIGAAVFFGGRYVRVQQELDLGRKYLDELDYEQAVIHFTSAIDIDDRNVPAYLGRGEANLGLEEYEQAEADYTMVIETLQAESVEAYVGRAQAYSGQGKTEEAEEDLRHAQDLGLSEEEAETIREEVLPAAPLTADQVTWVVEPIYDYQRVLPLRGRSFSDVEGPYCDGTQVINGYFYEMSFPGYSNLPQYYEVQLADGSWRLYYMPDHIDSGDIPMEAPDENFGTYPRYDATGIVNYAVDYDARYPYPWHLFAMLERGGGSTAVYYDTYTRQGILEGGFYSISLQPVAQAGLHKPYPAGTVSTEGTGVDANQTINWFYDSLPAGFDMDSYYDAIDSQKQEYPKCYIGTDGQPITDFLYDGAEDFSEGLAACSIDGKWGYIDENGDPVTEFVYDGVWDKSEWNPETYQYEPRDTGYPCTSDTMVVWKDGQVGLLYRDGSVLIDFGQFEDMAPAFNNELWAKQDGQWGLIDLADAKQKRNLDPELSVPEEIKVADPEWDVSYEMGLIGPTSDIQPDYPTTYSEAGELFNGSSRGLMTGSSMPLYEGPSTAYRVKEVIPADENVTILGSMRDNQDWVYVSWWDDGTSTGGWLERSGLVDWW